MSNAMDLAGNKATAPRAIVLLSGGMDSVMALHWALWRFQEVKAIAYDYGQPHRDAELVAGDRIARKRGVQLGVKVLADTMRPDALRGVPKHNPASDGEQGQHPAFVPARNLIFLSVALGEGAALWPGEPFDLVFGACKEDAAGFPDCREEFLRAADGALSAALDVRVQVCAPYVRMTKLQAMQDAFARFPPACVDVSESWSCYAGKGPCGECTPCVLRKEAFDAYGLWDKCATGAPWKLHGGDTHREMLLKGGE